ncbi:MAG: 4-hydroxy-tetrahydrodipicolinate reductase [Chitinophagaceae bacterium]|nr:4-hydroxy-tetrahydrodipicolinate reductase [Chitinophagaceae bacterium]
MRIALIGYGKMGKMVEEIAKDRKHEVILRITSANMNEFTKENVFNTDAAIEFTTPYSAFENVKKCIDYGVPVVSGTTGWNEKLPEVKNYCIEKDGTLLHASNFSIGVNIFFEINNLLARLMGNQPTYNVTIKEIHHTQKKDAPSGTAVILAEQILAHSKTKKGWINNAAASDEEIEIISNRIDPTPGTHHVKYTSEIDDIEIIHRAHNRKGFALGAILAAEYIFDKKGIFSMKDVLAL